METRQERGPDGSVQLRTSSHANAQLEDKSLVASLTDCLSFSPAFTLTGFETVNDKLLKEMNERARLQLENRLPSSRLATQPAQARPRSGPASTAAARPEAARRAAPVHSKPSSGAPVSHQRLYAGPAQPSLKLGPLNARHQTSGPAKVEPQPKRAGAGLESPSKRLRAPNGAPTSPTSSMSQLSLSEKERLTKVSAARQQMRRENASPRRRQLHRAGGNPATRPPMSLNAQPLPSLKLDAAADSTQSARAREPLGKPPASFMRQRGPQPHAPSPAPGMGPAAGRSVSQGRERGAPSIPRSTSARSVSATATSSARAPPADFDSLPSYARPTKAALQRSQSTAPRQQHGLSQHLRPSSSTRSVSQFLH